VEGLMIKILRTVLLIITILFISNHAVAEIYKWKDKDGGAHFSDVPPSSGEMIDTIETPKPSKHIPRRTLLNFALSYNTEIKKRKSKSTNSVEIFTTSWCGYCRKAISFLRSNGISFQQYDIEKNKKASARMKALGGSGGVPFAIINGNIVRGFSREKYRQALGLR
jgi:glutaredoxin